MRTMSRRTAEAVASRYGLGPPVRDPVYADRGELGRVWRLDTDRGSWAVKEADQLVPEVDAAADVAFQLAAAAAGVPLPRPVRTPAGAVLVPGVEVASAAAVLRVYAWAELHKNEVVTAAELGTVTALLHRIGHPAAGPVNAWFAEPLGADGWRELLASAQRAGAWWAAVLERWLPELIEADYLVTPPDDARTTTCHLDVNIENVRRGGDGGVVVLDWENSGPGQPERELAAILFDVDTDLGLDDARASYVAYREAGGPAELTGPPDFSTAIAVQGHLLRVYGDRALGGHEPEDRQRAERRLRQLLRQPLTPAHVSHLLRALR